MLVACALCHENTAGLSREEACAVTGQVIMGGLADYFYRLVITDIKPPVFYKIRENPEHFRQLTEYALDNLAPVLSAHPRFWTFMRSWHLSQEPSLARDILEAAHLFASRWEFNLIKPLNPFDEEMASINQSFVEKLDGFRHLNRVSELLNPEHPLARFANLCGQLRFQIRWTQTSRTPATTVLGHMFLVAAISYLYSLELDLGCQRSGNNFFAGLFHDFPEVLTRDIISPVKQSFAGLPRLIREYEREEMERRVLGPLRQGAMGDWADRIEWHLGLENETEFEECCKIGNEIRRFDNFEDLDGYDTTENDPRDGKLVKICDLLSAFLEAHNSIRNGSTSPHLVEGRARLKGRLAELAPKKLGISALLADFD